MLNLVKLLGILCPTCYQPMVYVITMCIAHTKNNTFTVMPSPYNDIVMKIGVTRGTYTANISILSTSYINHYNVLAWMKMAN